MVYFFVLTPSAAPQLLPEAGAERTLEGCRLQAVVRPGPRVLCACPSLPARLLDHLVRQYQQVRGYSES